MNEPKFFYEASQHDDWIRTMNEEIDQIDQSDEEEEDNE